MEQNNTQNDDWGAALSLEGRINVYPNKPLPDLGGPGGAAFAARFRSDPTQDLMAIVCNRGLFPRVDQVNSMRNVDCGSVIRLREAGPLYWPALNAHYYTFVYERPLLGSYWKSLHEQHPTMGEETVNHSFVIPLIKAMIEFHRTGIVHGGIRPTNIFWHNGSPTPPQIGESLSAPTGVGQPIAFETIERAMCEPIARGIGLHTDDCYALGVTLAMVFGGRNPFQGMDEGAITYSKIEKGSFNAVAGKIRLPAAHIELLRGLLIDDARQRWTAEDLEQWMIGRRMTPKSSESGRRASRHFEVGGKEFWHVRPLAMALAANIPLAVKLIENGSLEKWLVRSLADEERAKCVSDTISSASESGKSTHYQEQLVTKVCIALDPSAPIRYRGMAVMPTGIANVLVDAITTGNNLQVVSEIITAQFITTWVNMQKETKIDLVPMAQQLERMRGLIDKTSFGGGIERVMYELNPSLPCLSPMLKSEYVASPRFLLASLESVAARGGHPTDPMDRNIAAFLISREKRSEALFAAMGPNEQPMRRGLALLSLFGDMQYRYGPDKLPKLCSWILPLVEPCLNRFLSKPFQDKVRQQVRDAAAKGSISLLLRRVDDPDRVAGDEKDFLEARQMYRDIQIEMASIEENLKNKHNVVRELGKPVAASIASIIGIILIAITLGREMIHTIMGM